MEEVVSITLAPSLNACLVAFIGCAFVWPRQLSKVSCSCRALGFRYDWLGLHSTLQGTRWMPLSAQPAGSGTARSTGMLTQWQIRRR